MDSDKMNPRERERGCGLCGGMNLLQRVRRETGDSGQPWKRFLISPSSPSIIDLLNLPTKTSSTIIIHLSLSLVNLMGNKYGRFHTEMYHIPAQVLLYP